MKTIIPTALFAFILIGCQPNDSATEKEAADAIWYKGTIITINDSEPTAEAVAVKNGRTLAVGTEANVLRHQASTTTMHSLAGKTLLPGFVDAHGHLSFVGFQALSANLLPKPTAR